MPKVQLSERRLHDFAAIVEPEDLALIRERARPLVGLRVLHLSASPYGSSVAQMLAALVPLQRDLGLRAGWQVLTDADAARWSVLYEGLRGREVHWSRRARAAWMHDPLQMDLTAVRRADVVIVHDPQLLALAHAAGAPAQQWVWHCHLDTRAAAPDLWRDRLDVAHSYAAAVFPSQDLLRHDLGVPLVGVARPALDPWASANAPLPQTAVAHAIQRLGLDPLRPIVGIFAPFDRSYSPIAGIGAYLLARQQIPGLQLILADLTVHVRCATSCDRNRVLEVTADDPDIRVVTAEDALTASHSNALERGCAVTLQIGCPTGFSQGLAACLWKERPVIAGSQGSALPRVEDGRTGLLAEDAPLAAAGLVRLLRNPTEAQELGQRGHQHVRREHLVTGLLADHLALLQRLVLPAGNSVPEVPQELVLHHPARAPLRCSEATRNHG